MKGSEIYGALLMRSYDCHVDINLLYSAVLIMGADINATDEDIYRKYFEWEITRLGITPAFNVPVSGSIEAIYNEPNAYFKGVAYYLKPGTPILELHIEIYKNLTKIVPELWDRYAPMGVGPNTCRVIARLCGDIISSVRAIRGGRNSQ